MTEQVIMSECKRIALVAHNNKKTEFIHCLKQHRDVLSQHELFGTGTTGSLVEQALNLPVTKFLSGPLGGDQQLGCAIAEHKLDILLFLIDPLDCHPHNVDVQALSRLAEVWGIIYATTTASMDFILTSPKMNQSYTRHVHLTPMKKEEKQPVTSVQTRAVPATTEKSQFRFPHLSSKQRRSTSKHNIPTKCLSMTLFSFQL